MWICVLCVCLMKELWVIIVRGKSCMHWWMREELYALMDEGRVVCTNEWGKSSMHWWPREELYALMDEERVVCTNDRGKSCMHWWPRKEFYALMTEERTFNTRGKNLLIHCPTKNNIHTHCLNTFYSTVCSKKNDPISLLHKRLLTFTAWA